MFTSPLWDVSSAVCWYCTCTWITQWRRGNRFQTHVQVGSGEIGPLQIRAAQVGVRQVAAAQIGHLEIDVTQIQPGQISAAEIKTLKSQRVRELQFNLTWWSDDGDRTHCDWAVPDSAARTSWVSPGENGQTLCGRWESGPPEAASSVQRVRTWSWLMINPDPGSIKTACRQTLVWTEQPDWDRFKKVALSLLPDWRATRDLWGSGSDLIIDLSPTGCEFMSHPVMGTCSHVRLGAFPD